MISPPTGLVPWLVVISHACRNRTAPSRMSTAPCSEAISPPTRARCISCSMGAARRYEALTVSKSRAELGGRSTHTSRRPCDRGDACFQI